MGRSKIALSQDPDRPGSILSRRHAERVHLVLAEATELMDRISSDLETLLEQGEGVEIGNGEVGRLFILARGALTTAELLVSHAQQIMDRTEQAHYRAHEQLSSSDYVAYAERVAAWREKQASDYRDASRRHRVA